MRQTITILLFALVLPYMGLSGEKILSRPTKVESGSAVFTNALSVAGTTAGVPALELYRVEFALSTAALTNVFAIQRVRTYELPFVTTSSVITGTVNGVSQTYTNYHKYSGGTATYTNSYTLATTTNDTSTQWFDRDDFGDGLVLEPDDVVTFSFTETADFYMTHVYKVLER